VFVCGASQAQIGERFNHLHHDAEKLALKGDHFLPQNRWAFAFSLRMEGEAKPD
jgi:hypothetical protein